MNKIILLNSISKFEIGLDEVEFK